MSEPHSGEEQPADNRPRAVYGPLALAFELLEAIPRIAERTRAQADFSRAVLAHMPCVGAWFRPGEPVPVPAHEARQPTDVLTVVALHDGDDDSGDGGAAGPRAAEASEAPAPTSTAAPDPGPVAGGVPSPDVHRLAIPDYDSLAASQVVPRLTMLSAEELGEVGAYEAANRHRQTILNRVAQLLAD